jgi:glycosyltransferase involved in cell wall biosynthesis
MRLYVVAGSYHPEVGGPSTYLRRLMPALIERGHHVSVITYTDSPNSSMDDNFPYEVYRIARKWPLVLRLLLFTINILWRARGYDVLFVSDYGLPAILANLILRKPMILKNVSDFAWEFSVRHDWINKKQTIDEFQNSRHGWRVRVLKKICSWYTAKASLVVVPSKYIAQLVTGWGVTSERIRVIYNALDESRFNALPNKIDARKALGYSEKSILVLTAARLVSWKGIDGVIRAIDKIRTDFPEVKLIVVGDGPERRQLENLAAECNYPVQFLGFRTQQNLYHVMRAADVFILFSTYEGMPHSVLEAMACGIPVVASSVGGTVEVIIDQANGLLVPAGDETALAENLGQLLSNPSLARKISAGASNDLQRFSWDRLVRKTEDALLEVIN